MEQFRGTQIQRQGQAMGVPPIAPRRRPTVTLHKETTCNFWARGDCRYSEEECPYAHSWTDLVVGQPIPYHPGRLRMTGSNTHSAPANVQAQHGIMQPSPGRNPMLLDPNGQSPEKVIRPYRPSTDLIPRYDPRAAAFEPPLLKELRAERTRAEHFLNLIHDQAALNLKLSEELEKSAGELRRLSKDVRDVAEAIHHGREDLSAQIPNLVQQSNEIETMAKLHEKWNGQVDDEIMHTHVVMQKWERPDGRRVIV